MQTPELLSDPVYHDEDAARSYLERTRWPEYVHCPLCGSLEKISQLGGESMGPGWWFCGSCKEKFTLRVGTVMERSHIPLHKWLLAFRLMASSKKGCSAHQLHRTLGVTYKTAWFLAHRIRFAMADFGKTGPMGAGGGVVEADETYVGRKPGRHRARGWGHKNTVFTLVEREGQARSFHITGKMFDGVKKALRENVSPDARLATDEARMYRKIAKQFAEHMAVNHSQEEYVRG